MIGAVVGWCRARPCGPADPRTCAGVSCPAEAREHPRSENRTRGKYNIIDRSFYRCVRCARVSPLSIRFLYDNAMGVASRSVCVAQVCDRDGTVSCRLCVTVWIRVNGVPIVPLKPSHRRAPPSICHVPVLLLFAHPHELTRACRAPALSSHECPLPPTRAASASSALPPNSSALSSGG